MTHEPISFPGLGITVNPSPVAFYLGEKPIYWYGILIAAGFFLAVLYGLRLCRREGISEEKMMDLILIVTPISIIGARTYYILFYNVHYDSFYDMIAIWHGGLAIYGAVIAAAIGGYIACRIKKMPPLRILDIAAVCFPIGQAVGRWGNFMNREAYGGLSTSFLRMEITLREAIYDRAGGLVAAAGERVAVHPTFLYESLWNALGFLFLAWMHKKHNRFAGQSILLYLIWYGSGRAVIEGLRTDSLYIPGTAIRVSQLFGIITALVSLLILVAVLLIRRTKGFDGPAVRMDGFAASVPLRAQIKEQVDALYQQQGLVPGLGVILVGSDPAGELYITHKREACKEVGIYSEVQTLPADASELQVLDLVEQLHDRGDIHGILIQLPLPKGIRKERVIDAIGAQADVDCLHPDNLEALVAGKTDGPVPCTPAGILALLDFYGVSLAGKQVVIVGRSELVGRPLLLVLEGKGAAVTVCHSKTEDLARICRGADILITAAGQPGLITGSCVKPHAVVVDVGTTRLADGNFVGDCEASSVKKVARMLTPVPGGVGPMTVTMLLQNTLRAAAKKE